MPTGGPLVFELPKPVNGNTWHRVVDTALVSPKDILEEGKEIKMKKNIYKLAPRSILVCISK